MMAAAIAAFLQFSRANQRNGKAMKKGNVHFVNIPRPATTPNAIVHRILENPRVCSNSQMAAATMRSASSR